MPLPGFLSSKPPWRTSRHQENDQECPSLKFDVNKLSKSSKVVLSSTKVTRRHHQPCRNGTATSPPPTLRTFSFRSIMHCKRSLPSAYKGVLKRKDKNRKEKDFTSRERKSTWCLRSMSSPKRNSILGESSTTKEQG